MDDLQNDVWHETHQIKGGFFLYILECHKFQFKRSTQKVGLTFKNCRFDEFLKSASLHHCSTKYDFSYQTQHML